MPLVINGLRGRHTDRHTHNIPMREPKQFQETKRARPLAMRTWCKKTNIISHILFCTLWHHVLDQNSLHSLDNT